MDHPAFQAQSVIYNNDIPSLMKAIAALANGVRIERQERGLLGRVSLHYGDASPEPVLRQPQVQKIKEQFGEYLDFEYQVFGFNSGSAKGQNLLAENCRAEYLLIMNPDIIVSPRFLTEIMKPFAEEKVGMVEARQTPVEHHKEYNIETMETDWATGACTAVRTGLFHELGGFDADTFFMYCDDVDLSWRVRLSGYRIIYQPSAPAYHAKRLSAKGQWQTTHAEQYYSAEAAILMAYKWSNPDRVDKLLDLYLAADNEFQNQAAKHFLELKEAGKLPAQLDGEHKVSKFVGEYYTENRFVL